MLRLRQTFWRADWFFVVAAIVLVTLSGSPRGRLSPASKSSRPFARASGSSR